MPSMKFLKLSLLSQKERRAFSIEFKKQKTVLVGGNGFGKSAILKSLYDALGARPHRIDKSWQDADVTTLLEFSVDGAKYAILKQKRLYSLFAESRTCLLSTDSVTDTLGPWLATLLSFGLVLADRKDKVRTPPPSFAFAPFYVDQDEGWGKPWASFRDLGMFPRSARPLAEYHSGLRTNEYYWAQSERDIARAELRRIDIERGSIVAATQRLKASFPSTGVKLNLTHFEQETEELLREAQQLHDREAAYRTKLAVTQEEMLAWNNHVQLLKSAIAEQDASLHAMLGEGSHVECPVCGQKYDNGVAEQFELTADKDDLVEALSIGQGKQAEVLSQFEAARDALDGIRASIENVDRIMAIKKADVTMREVIASEGRSEAERMLAENLTALDKQWAEINRRSEDCLARMKEIDGKKRRADLNAEFQNYLRVASLALDEPSLQISSQSIFGVNIGRGSQGPRELMAYYYSFLHMAAAHGTSAFCPIVIDAPNQQGQDAPHVEAIMKFLMASPPAGAQVVVGTEVFPLEADANTDVVELTSSRNQVLRTDFYDDVLGAVTEYYLRSLQ